MNNTQFPLARKRGLVIQDVPNEVLVYDLEADKAHCLNQTAAAVWRACDGTRTVSEIADYLGRQAGKNVPEELVWLAIDQLNENRLMESEAASGLTGTSRREAIKKIGMAAMIALPIVASMAAPKKVWANTSCACVDASDCVGTSCPSTNNCNTGGLCAP